MENAPTIQRTIRQPAARQTLKRIHGTKVSRMSDNVVPPIQPEQVSVFDRCVQMLEDCNSPVVDRVKYLGYDVGDDTKMSDGSLEKFAGILCRTGWVPPTSIGLNDQGLISASWQNPHFTHEEDKFRCPGMATMLFPELDGQFQLTAMFGDAKSGRPWIQVVGNLEEKDALVFLDQIISGFYK